MNIESMATDQWSLRRAGFLVVAALLAAAAAYATRGPDDSAEPVQLSPASPSASAAPGADEPVLLARRGRRK